MSYEPTFLFSLCSFGSGVASLTVGYGASNG